MPKMLFTQVQYDLNGLMNAVKMGQIGLPDIQREFRWKNTTVRDREVHGQGEKQE